MAKIVVSQQGIVEGHYFLDQPRFTLGRLPDSDIYLNHPGVSNMHAVIVTVSNDHILEDLGSTNGTLVNGEKVTKYILQNNDLIELGSYQLKYVNQRATADMDFDKTMITKVAITDNDHLTPQPVLATAVSSARALKTSFPLGGVRHTRGELTGHEILIDAPLKTFGCPGSQLLMISRRRLGYYVTHVEGRRTPRINGKAIGTQPVLLHPRDRVEMADLELEFYLKPEAEPIVDA